MTVRNGLSRYHLAQLVLERVPRLENLSGHLRAYIKDRFVDHERYIRERGEDLPEIRDWRWPGASEG